MLATFMVGLGAVVASMAAARSIAVAPHERARAAGCRRSGRGKSVESFADPVSLDVVVGRYVLIHQADPAHYLRRVTTAGPAG